MTKAEILLWSRVRVWSSQGVRLRRQHPIPPYIVDFAHIPSHTIIEVDGRSHTDRNQHDKARSIFLEQLGWTILRFNNETVLTDLDEVVSAIAIHLTNQGFRFKNNFQIGSADLSHNETGEGDIIQNTSSSPSPDGEGQGWGDNSQNTSLFPSPDGEGQGWGDIIQNTSSSPSPDGEGQGWGDNSQNTSLSPSPDGEGQGWGDQPRGPQPNQSAKITHLTENSGLGKTSHLKPQLSDLLDHPALAKIKLLTANTKFENQIHLVGGAIRDALLSLPQKNDFDLVTEYDAIELAEFLHGADPNHIPNPQIYARFGTAMLHIAGVNIELITARRESYNPNSRKPNIQPATITDDALRRDFTINTLLLNLHTQELLDPLNTALNDLENQVIRTPLDPLQTFSDDPLRMLRAVRFKHQLGFTFSSTPRNLIESHALPTNDAESLPLTRSGSQGWGDTTQNTSLSPSPDGEGQGWGDFSQNTSPPPSPDGEGQGWGNMHGENVSANERSINDLTSAIRTAAPRLTIISQERIRDEFTKILLGSDPDLALQDLLDLNLLHSWASELEAMVGIEQGQWHYADVWTHTLHVVKNVRNTSFDPSPDGEGMGWGDITQVTSLSPSPDGEGQGWGDIIQNTSLTPSPEKEGMKWREIKSSSQELELLLAALLHDIAKPITQSIDSNGQIRFFNHENIGADLAYELCLRWRYSQDTATAVRLLVKNHMRLTGIKKLTIPATRRIIRDLGPQLNNWLTLVDADANALKSGVRHLDLSELKSKIQELQTQEPQSNYNSPLTGQEIMTIAKIPPGPQVGFLKEQLANLVIEGKIPLNDKSKAKKALQTILRNRPKS